MESRSAPTDSAVEPVKLLRDCSKSARVEVDVGCHGQKSICQVAQDKRITRALFDVTLDSVEDGDEVALALRVEPSNGALDRRDERDGGRVVLRGRWGRPHAWAWRLMHLQWGAARPVAAADRSVPVRG